MIITNANPIRGRHDVRQAAYIQKELYKGGTPRWISHPKEFKAMAIEDYLASKEQSNNQVKGYKLTDQELLEDANARFVNPMGTRDFLYRLRSNGIKCFTSQTPPRPGVPIWLCNTTGLFCLVREKGLLGFQHIYNLRIPFMFEWSVLLVDKHGLQAGHLIGWRTVLKEMITRKVFTERRAHEVFGKPTGAQSKIYRRTLYEFRNGRHKNNERATWESYS